MVLQHLKSMRATDSEVAKLRQQWTEGSTIIATQQAKLDERLGALADQFVNFKNRLGPQR